MVTKQRNIRVAGLDELEKKLGADFLFQPEIEDIRGTIVKRIMRGGKGLGAQRNQITAQPEDLGAIVETTLTNPRNTGKAWGHKNQRIVGSMAPRVFAKAARNIEARWAAESGGGLS
jgi:hypothetical protein